MSSAPGWAGAPPFAGFDAAAYRSADRGIHWSQIKGYTFKWGYRIIPDLNDATKIYITTCGGGLWHGPAIGDPKGPEDILTPIQVAH